MGEAEKALPWEFDLEGGVDDRGDCGGQGENVDPVPGTDGHAVAGQEGAAKAEGEQKQEDDGRRRHVERILSSRRDIDHGVDGRQEEPVFRSIAGKRRKASAGGKIIGLQVTIAKLTCWSTEKDAPMHSCPISGLINLRKTGHRCGVASAVLLGLCPVHVFKDRGQQVGDEEASAPDRRRDPEQDPAHPGRRAAGGGVVRGTGFSLLKTRGYPIGHDKTGRDQRAGDAEGPDLVA